MVSNYWYKYCIIDAIYYVHLLVGYKYKFIVPAYIVCLIWASEGLANNPT